MIEINLSITFDNTCIFDTAFFGFRHLKNTSDMTDFSIVSEEAISKGIRRIVAITGHDATKVIEYFCFDFSNGLQIILALVHF